MTHIKWTQITSTEPKTRDIHYSPVHMEHSQGTDYMLGHKTSLNKFKPEITPTIFSDHNALKLEINCKKEVGNPTNM